MTSPNPTPTGTQVAVFMLVPLGGHKVGDLIQIDSSLVDMYVAAGYVRKAN